MKVRLTNIPPNYQYLHRFPGDSVEADLQPRGGMGNVYFYVNKDGKRVCLDSLELWGSGIKLVKTDTEESEKA